MMLKTTTTTTTTTTNRSSAGFTTSRRSLLVATLWMLEGVRGFTTVTTPSSSIALLRQHFSTKLFAIEQRDDGDVFLGQKYRLQDSKLQESTSGKSILVEAAIPDKEVDLLVKFSDNINALKREVKNYNRVATEETKGLFVEIHDFYNPNEDNPEKQLSSPDYSQSMEATTQNYTDYINTDLPKKPDHVLKGQAALVMERGSQDLKSYIKQNGPLQGISLRRAVARTAKTVKAFHAQKLVWTELKSENFVVNVALEEDRFHETIKAIDLESAVKKGKTAIDFTPEAIPPEFAEAYLYGREATVQMQKSFDIFSLGLLWYKMAVGRRFWQDEFFDEETTDLDVIKIAEGMKNRDKLDLTRLEEMGTVDRDLIQLISSCLQVNPDNRPKIDDLLQHPYISKAYEFNVYKNLQQQPKEQQSE
jgi:serine/threonine protein kinase